MKETQMTEEEMGEMLTTCFSAEPEVLSKMKAEYESSCRSLETGLQTRGFNSTPMFALAVQIGVIRMFIKALSNDDMFDTRFAVVLGVMLRESFLQAETEMIRATLLRGS